MPTATHKQRILQRLLNGMSRAAEPSEATERPVLEHLIFGVCREGTTCDRAERAFRNLQTRFFDWNEVRVSSSREVEEALEGIPDAEAKSERIVKLLQEIFETTYSFDLEGLHKKGLKLAEKQLERYQGCNPFSIAYVMQHGLGGHALPIDQDMERALLRMGFAEGSADPAAARAGLDHLVPKAKGSAFCENLSLVAQEYCVDGHPRCSQCQLKEDCPTGLKFKAQPRKLEKAPTKAKAKVK